MCYTSITCSEKGKYSIFYRMMSKGDNSHLKRRDHHFPVETTNKDGPFRPCKYCGTATNNKRRHMEEVHLPFWLMPHTACFYCEEPAMQHGMLMKLHLNSDVNPHPLSAGLTDQNLELYTGRMNNLLHKLRRKLGFSRLDDLLAYVRVENENLGLIDKRNPVPIRVSPYMHSVMRGWEILNNLRVTDKYEIAPPNSLASLTHWKVISVLLEKIPNMINEIKEDTQCADINGANMRELVFSPDVTFIDCHFHPDKLMEHLHCLEWEEVVAKAIYTYYYKPQYLIASLVFPRGWDIMEELLTDPTIRISLGIHPRLASVKGIVEELEEFERHWSNPRVVGMGEIGLEYHGYSYEECERQKSLLKSQCRIAREKDLPVTVHCGNGTAEDCREILSSYLPSDHRVMLHSFAGSEEEYRFWMQKFYWVHVSISQLALRKVHDSFDHKFPHRKHLHKKKKLMHPCAVTAMISSTPLPRILIETDAPYLAGPGNPKPMQPWQIAEVAEYIGFIKNMSTLQILELTRENAIKFFQLQQ